MKKIKQYLSAKDAPFVPAGLNKLSWMLESDSEEDIFLGLALLKGGGVPETLLTRLLALSLFHHNEKVRRKAKGLFASEAPTSLYDFVKKKWRYDYRYSMDEQQISAFLSEISQDKRINKQELGNLALKFIHKGGKFCLENHTGNVIDILSSLCRQNRLSLAYFGLQTLPKEIGQMTHLISLHIGGNNFTEIPDEMAYLTNLTHLYYDNTPLSDVALQKLAKFFPKIFAGQWLEKAQRFLHSHFNYTEALHCVENSILLYPEGSEAWQMKGILAQKMKNHEEALEYLRKAISLNPDDMLAWNAKAVSLYKLQKHKEALDVVAHALDILHLKSHKDKIWEVQLHTLKGDFLQDMVLFDQAHTAYDQALKINSESIIPILQKARLFAQTQEVCNMYTYLEKALTIKPVLSKELLSDKCFKPFSQEAAFQKLISHYHPTSTYSS